MSLPAPAPSMQPDPTEVNLLTSAEPLPAPVATFDRWRTGLSQRSTYEVRSGRWPVDCVDGDKEPVNDDAASLLTFNPVSLYTHHGCTGRVDTEAYRAEAIAKLDQVTPYLLAEELWTGSVSGNPSLQSTAFDLTPYVSTGLSVAEGAAALLAFYEGRTFGAKAILHVPQVVAFELIDDVFCHRQGNRLVTPNGHIVIPGPGYPNSAGNTGPVGTDPTTLGEFYIYVTGAVEIGVHTIFTTGAENNAVGGYARQNLVEFYAERLAAYRFSGPVGAVRVEASFYAPGS